MLEKQSHFRFVKRACTRRPADPNCPVAEGKEFNAIEWSRTDEYRVYQIRSHTLDAPALGNWFAACPNCKSHALVEKLD